MDDTPAAWRAAALSRAIAIEAEQKYGVPNDEPKENEA